MSNSDFYVLPSFFRKEALHLISGSPYAGKSTLIAQIAGTLVGATTPFLPNLEFRSIPKEEIGFIFTDRDRVDNDSWLRKLGIADVSVFSVSDDKDRKTIDFLKATKNSQSDSINYLKYCISQLDEQVRLIFIDVFTNIFVGDNIHNLSSVHKHMMLVQRLCKEKGVTIVGTAYGSKQKQGAQDRYVRLVDRIIGAATLRGCATDLAYLATPEESAEKHSRTDFQEFHWIPRAGQMQKFALARDNNGFFYPRSDVDVANETFSKTNRIVQNVSGENQEATITIDGMVFFRHDNEVKAEAYQILGMIPKGGIKKVDLVKLIIDKLGCSQAQAYKYVRALQTYYLDTLSDGLLVLRNMKKEEES